MYLQTIFPFGKLVSALTASLTLLGKGTMTWKKLGAIYDGDWKDDHRCGFGTYSLPEGAGYRKVYSGGWKNDKRHVCIHVFHSMQRIIFLVSPVYFENCQTEKWL